jgi:phage-related protein
LARLHPPVLRPVVWLGNSKKNLRGFPDGAQKLLGDELQRIQFGGMPKDAKPFKGVGSGVVEIALRHASDAYRVVCAAADWQAHLCIARLSKEIEERHCNHEVRC